MKHAHRLLCFFALLSVFSDSLRALTIGSDLAVSRQAFVIFPAADTDNEIRGFAYMSGGFALEDATTSCTFNGLFPVSQEIDLNGGQLFLQTDLLSESLYTFTSLGTLIASSPRTLSLSNALTQLGSANAPAENLFENIILELGANTVLNEPIRFKGACSILGSGNILELAETASIIIDTESTLVMQNVQLTNVGSTNVQCTDGTSQLVLQDVSWVQNAPAHFTEGSILFKEDNEFLGSYTFYYESPHTSTIDPHAVWRLSSDMHVCTGRHPVTNRDPIVFADSTGKLQLDDCSFLVTSSGMILSKGILELSRAVNFETAATGTAYGLTFGTGDIAEDLTVVFNPAAAVRFNTGQIVYNNASPTAFQSFANTARFSRGPASHLYGAQNLTLPRITIEAATEDTESIIMAPGKQLSFDNSTIVFPAVTFDIKGARFNLLSLLLTNNNYISFTTGSLPAGVVVTGSGNKLAGSGNALGPIIFTSPNSSLTMDINGFMGNSITLANGRLNLDLDLNLLDSGSISGPGTIDLGQVRVKFYGHDIPWNSSTKFIGNNGSIVFEDQIDLAGTWTINGVVHIDGDGAPFVLQPGAGIMLESGGQLYFDRVRVLGVNGDNIRCADDSCTLVLNDAELVLDDDYTFSVGKLQIQSDSAIKGEGTFFYDTQQTSTINTQSTLGLQGVQLRIGRQNGVEPLYLTDRSSTLQATDASIYVKSPGVQIIHGTIKFSGNSGLDIEGTTTADGLQLGNGVAADDTDFVIDAGSVFDWRTGSLVYNNVSNSRIISGSQNSIILGGSTANFRALNDFVLDTVTIDFQPGFAVTPITGKTVLADSVITQGPFGASKVTGQVVVLGLFGLNGNNDSVNIVNGYSPFVMRVTGTANTVTGEGKIGNTVLFTNDQASLSSSLRGTLGAALLLNGGRLRVLENLRFANNLVLTGSGDVEFVSAGIDFGGTDLSWTGSIDWSGTSGVVALHSNVVLSGIWTFTGDCTIQGNGYTIDLDATGQLLVQDGGSLTLKSTRVDGIIDGNFKCLGDESVMFLDDVTLILHDDTVFDAGALSIKNRVAIAGDGVFAYQSAQTSTILSDARLRLDEGITFSYDPIFVASKDLIHLYDDSSQITLNGATLHSTTTGMQLINGIFSVAKNSVIECESYLDGFGADVNEGITFGNNNGDDDIRVLIETGVKLQLNVGYLIYRNANIGSLRMGNNRSTLEIGTGCLLALYESMNVDPGSAVFQDSSTLGLASGKDLFGSVVPLGSFNRIDLP